MSPIEVKTKNEVTVRLSAYLSRQQCEKLQKYFTFKFNLVIKQDLNFEEIYSQLIIKKHGRVRYLRYQEGFGDI